MMGSTKPITKEKSTQFRWKKLLENNYDDYLRDHGTEVRLK